eukprot:TRINITY_DN32646_c0_g1_i1.p1 TRINITY_DN32646_c0_g1~~TRINITY_DN32646_c0_g1_i1.p1  ORF type:complete len:634 (+),score=94.52 TRINITY_DN32646_c0_g1_i1:57-1958(+)
MTTSDSKTPLLPEGSVLQRGTSKTKHHHVCETNFGKVISTCSKSVHSVHSPAATEKDRSVRCQKWGFVQAAVEDELESRFKLYQKEVSSGQLKREWWYHHGFSGTLLVSGLYFWTYAIYIVSIILIGAMCMWAWAPKGELEFLDALYVSAACASQSGLSTIDYSAQAPVVHVVGFIVTIMGSMCLLTVIPAFLRRRSFEKQVLADLSTESSPMSRRSRTGSWPLSPVSRAFKRFVSTDSLRFTLERSFSTDSVLAAWEDEYNALGLIMMIVLGYWFTVHLIGFLVIYGYMRYGPSEELRASIDSLGLRQDWHALYLTVSSFQNNGLLLTPDSLVSFAEHPVILCAVSALILAGNTALPINIRFVTWSLFKLSGPGKNQDALRFLLKHPRRCYTHMFPFVHTLWLILALFSLTSLTFSVILLLDSKTEAMAHLSPANKVFNSLLQAASARTAGVNSVDIGGLTMASTFILIIVMYISTSPTVVTMRYSQLQKELDITGRAEGLEDAVEGGNNTLRAQARRYLIQHTAYLVVITFFILVWEEPRFHEEESVERQNVQRDYNFLKVVFELVSAYGTVGLSLGYRNAAYSFSGAWSRGSQLLLIFAMLLGRLRGLPDSVDPSVATAMRRSISMEEEE